MLKPIETHYNGFRFRSRLEARWAVFFDSAGIPYEYEPEGFDIDGIRYLPDFWLPNQEAWIEVKPNQNFSNEEENKLLAFAGAISERNSKRQWINDLNEFSEPYWDFWVLCGSPFPEDYVAVDMHRQYEECHFFQCVACLHIHIGSINEDWSQDEIAYYCSCCDVGECRGGVPGRENVWETVFHKGDICVPKVLDPRKDRNLTTAYTTARSARFEYGETP